MKQFFGILLCLCLLLSMAACERNEAQEQAPEEEKKITFYLVTEQKTYTNGQLSASAAFTYDAHGRPLVMQLQNMGGKTLRCQITYDEQGNPIRENVQQQYPDMAEPYTYDVEFVPTYENGRLTAIRQSTVSSDGTSSETVNTQLHYDSEGHLILAEYTGNTQYRWNSYVYDGEGRLVQETRCMCNQLGVMISYVYRRAIYTYDSEGRLVEHQAVYALSDRLMTQQEADALTYENAAGDHVYFYYGSDGRLIRTSGIPMTPAPDESQSIYHNDQCSFDENGNLIRVQQGADSWTEYTYAAIEITEEEAVMAKRLMHGVSSHIANYNYLACMDPKYAQQIPLTLYLPTVGYMHHYYLIDYPQFALTI